jgi:hypothetical protein
MIVSNCQSWFIPVASLFYIWKMRWLLFLSRLALICNFFFLLSASLQVYDWAQNSEVNSTILIIGYFLALLLNPLTNLCYLVAAILRKKLTEALPLWLIVFNIIFLVIQLLFIIYLTASNNTVS